MRPLTEGKLQAGLVCRRQERVNKKKEKKTTKYIETSALPVRNGARKVRKRTQEVTAARERAEKTRSIRNAVASARNSTHALAEYKIPTARF